MSKTLRQMSKGVIMSEKDIEEMMYREGVQLLKKRYGDKEGGVGVIRIEDGRLLTSVWCETNNSCVDLCAETGAILEAFKYDKKITHSLCVVNDNGTLKVLTPCGVCQERLYYFGGDVMCAISNPDNLLIFKPLKELQPYYWREDKR